MVLFDFATGSRRGELSGVKWEDPDVEGKIFIPKRSIVKQRISKVKTEASKKAIPLDDGLNDEAISEERSARRTRRWCDLLRGPKTA